MNSIKKKNNKGLYLKEVVYEFILHKHQSKLTVDFIEEVIQRLIVEMKTKLVSVAVNPLPPGFDILACIKESCIYFGYWGEEKYCRFIISSCKNFNELKIYNILKGFFSTCGVIFMDVREDTTICEKMKWLKKTL